VEERCRGWVLPAALCQPAGVSGWPGLISWSPVCVLQLMGDGVGVRSCYGRMLLRRTVSLGSSCCVMLTCGGEWRIARDEPIVLAVQPLGDGVGVRSCCK
jgi:hypothetical protein